MSNADKKSWQASIVDSALVLAIVSAVCYVVGFLVDLRDARALGLPRHLLPEYSIQAQVLSGGVALLSLAAILLLVFLGAHLLGKLLPDQFKDRFHNSVVSAIAKHPRIYTFIGVILLASALVILPLRFVPVRPSYVDAALPRVQNIHPQPKTWDGDEETLYLCTRGEFIILKRKGKRSFVVLKTDSVKEFEITHEMVEHSN